MIIRAARGRAMGNEERYEFSANAVGKRSVDYHDNHATLLRLAMGATVMISPNGFSRRLNVSWVELCFGLIARRRLELATPAFLENSFTPNARIAFPNAT